MATDVEIVNRALSKIGAKHITTLSDNTKEAREASAMFGIVRDALLREYSWRFAVKRASVTVDATAPAFGYTKRYAIPADCLRLIQVGEFYPGPDLTDYVGSAVEPYAVEGGFILTDDASPIKIRYIFRVEDESKFDALFIEALACRLAMELAEPITGNNGKRQLAQNEYMDLIRRAVRANAIENPPTVLADGKWLIARL